MATQRATLIDTAIQIGLIALLALWCFQIAAPFIGPIVWAGIIAIGIYPLYEWIKNKTGMSAGWTSTMFPPGAPGKLWCPFLPGFPASVVKS